MSAACEVFPTAHEAAEACAARILATLSRMGTLVLSGGSTPKPMFDALARSGRDWSGVHIFWADERPVGPEHEDSNYRLAEEHLIRPAGIPAANVHRIHGELEPRAAAARYDAEIREFFGLTPRELPRFDVVHLGMGSDAHTASLFPGEPLIEDRDGIAAAVWVAKKEQWRVTLLPGVLGAARQAVVLAAGADKAEPLRQVLYGERRALQYPAQLAMHATWFLDAAAATLLGGS